MTEKPFHATSNLTFDGQFPDRVGRPADTQDFANEAEARAWLRAHGGGAVSFHNGKDWQSITVEAGA